MLKKICVFCLAFVLSLSTIGIMPTFAASESRVQLLTDLGIIDLSEKTGLIPKSFTRGDFAASLNKLARIGPANISPEEEAAALYAADIAGNSNVNEIVPLLELGYMETDSENMFRPGQPITRTDALKALVRTLGYESVVQQRGGGDTAYYSLAQGLGLLKGVSIENPEKLTANEAAELLAGALTAYLFSNDVYLGEERSFYDSWMLEERTGRILANSNMGLMTDRTGYKRVNIDGVLYNTELLIADELVGSYVVYYVRDAGEGAEVVSISVKKPSDTLTLDADDIESVTQRGNSLEIVYDNDEELTIKKTGYALVNGKTMSPTLELFNAFKSGTATFVDTDNDGNCDVVHINLLLQTIIDGVYAPMQSLATRYDKQLVDLSEPGRTEIYLNKRAADITELTAGMVAGIACDAFTITATGEISYDFDKAEYIKIYASDKKTDGFVSMCEEDGITLDDMSYDFGPGYDRLIAGGHISPLAPGDYVTLYMDNAGKIVYYEIDLKSSSMRYGYLIAAKVEQAGLKEGILVKIMDTEGNFSTVSTADTFILDGQKVDANSLNYDVTGTTVDLSQRQLVRYRASEERLAELDTRAVRTTAETADTTLSEDLPFDPYVTGNAKYKIRSGAVDRKFAFTEDCVVFIDEARLEDSNPSESYFTVAVMETGSTAEYAMAGYDTNDNNELSCVVRYDSYGMTEGDAIESLEYHLYNCYIVEKVTQSISEDGREGYRLSLAGDNKRVSHFVPVDNLKLYATQSVDDWGFERIKIYAQNPLNFTDIIKTGDTIRFKVNAKDEITYIEKMFDFESHKDTVAAVPNIGGQTYGFAKVEKVSGNNIIYSYDDPADDTTYIFKKRSVYSVVPLYHVNRGKVELVDLAALPSAASGNDVKVFLRYYNYGVVYDHIFYIYD